MVVTMDKPLSKKLADKITPDIIEILGDDTCTAIDEMLNSNCPDEKIIDLIDRRFEKLDGSFDVPFYRDILVALRGTCKYQAEFNALKKAIPRTLPLSVARKRCFDQVGLQGYALMDDLEVKKSIIRKRSVGLMAKALLVKDYIISAYGVSLNII